MGHRQSDECWQLTSSLRCHYVQSTPDTCKHRHQKVLNLVTKKHSIWSPKSTQSGHQKVLNLVTKKYSIWSTKSTQPGHQKVPRTPADTIRITCIATLQCSNADLITPKSQNCTKLDSTRCHCPRRWRTKTCHK